MEEKIIEGFEYYKINEHGVVTTLRRVIQRTDGKVYTQREQIVKQVFNNRLGRYYIGIRNSEGKQILKSVHRLIAIAFIPNPNNLPEVNHKNGIKTDNRIDNLEWCTRLHNTRHAESLGLKNHTRGVDHYMYSHGQSKTKEYQRIWHRVTNRGYDWNSLTEAQRTEIGNSPKLSSKQGKTYG